MANFNNIAQVLEGILNTQLNLGRGNQGQWEWYNALMRIMSANRFTGTPRVYGPTLVTVETEIEANAVTLFGILVDNAMAAEDGFVAVANLTAANWTAGTSDSVGYYWAPRASQAQHLFPNGIVMNTALTIEDIIGTQAGQELGTGTTSGLTCVVVYTE